MTTDRTPSAAQRCNRYGCERPATVHDAEGRWCPAHVPKIGSDQESGSEVRERRGFDGLRDGVAAGYSKQAGATAPEHPAASPSRRPE
jgi:hypothetical protein